MGVWLPLAMCDLFGLIAAIADCKVTREELLDSWRLPLMANWMRALKARNKEDDFQRFGNDLLRRKENG